MFHGPRRRTQTLRHKFRGCPLSYTRKDRPLHEVNRKPKKSPRALADVLRLATTPLESGCACVLLTTHAMFCKEIPFYRTSRPLVLSSFRTLCVRHIQKAHPRDPSTKHFDIVLSRMPRLMLPCILVTVVETEDWWRCYRVSYELWKRRLFLGLFRNEAVLLPQQCPCSCLHVSSTKPVI